MKELKEYRDEIFRRSDEKKRQIKKRRRTALAVCTPLCLCCVLTVILLPKGLSKGMFAPSMEMVGNDYMVFEDAETTLQTFQVTDPDQVEQVMRLLDGGFQLNREEDNKNAVSDRVIPGSYRLSLETADGQVLTYHISDATAYCETTGQTVTLSENQALALYDLVTQS